MPQRLAQLQTWLAQQLPALSLQLQPITGDASFRRYFRLQHNGLTYIAVDSPPATENNPGFVDIAKGFASQGLNVPQVFAADLTNGFLLVSDLGDTLYLKNITPQNADSLYRLALSELVKIQRCSLSLPLFDIAVMNLELQRFREWLLEKHLQIKLSPATEKMLNQTFELLLASATEQPQCCIHRDYHSRNLMLLANNKLGILDFQDAMQGPVTYDAVSLLRDAYIDWPREQVIQWSMFFYQQIKNNFQISSEQYIRWFDLMGMQRHLKASFIFARKYHRDGVTNYLADIPRTLRYIINVSATYPELKDFNDWVTNNVYQQLLAGTIL